MGVVEFARSVGTDVEQESMLGALACVQDLRAIDTSDLEVIDAICYQMSSYASPLR